MPSPTCYRLLFVGLLSGTVALGCSPTAGTTVDLLSQQPAARESAAAKRTPTPDGFTGPVPLPDRPVKTAGVAGLVDLNGSPLANADVKLYMPGQTTPFAAGKTGADGRFSMAIGVIATGGGNVIATGGGNVISVGGGNVIATGGGNAIAAGSPLKVIASKDGANLATIAAAGVIATGGGNVIATGGGNVISTGGGNVISTGGGNYRVAQATASPTPSPSASASASPSPSASVSPTPTPTPSSGTSETKLTLASTLTVLKLGADLDKAMAAAAKGEALDAEKARSVFSAFGTVQQAAEQSLTSADADTRTALSKALDGQGKATSAASAGSLKTLTDTLETAAQAAQEVLRTVASPKPSPSAQATKAPSPSPSVSASPSASPSPSPSTSPSPVEFPLFAEAIAAGWEQTGGTLTSGAGLTGNGIVVNYAGAGQTFTLQNVGMSFEGANYKTLRVALKGNQTMNVEIQVVADGEPLGNVYTMPVQTGTYKTTSIPLSELGILVSELQGASIVFKAVSAPSTLYIDNLVLLP